MREAIFHFLGLLEESWGWDECCGGVLGGGGGEVCLCAGYGPSDL